jgi:hypothetical protein
MGGWPAVEGAAWDHNRFDWVQNVYINRRLGYSVDLLFDFSITTNIKNSSWRIIDVSMTFRTSVLMIHQDNDS